LLNFTLFSLHFEMLVLTTFLVTARKAVFGFIFERIEIYRNQNCLSIENAQYLVHQFNF